MIMMMYIIIKAIKLWMIVLWNKLPRLFKLGNKSWRHIWGQVTVASRFSSSLSF